MQFIQGNDDLGVTVAFELITSLLLQLLSNSVMVVQFTVDNSVDFVLGIVYRLTTFRAQILNS